ncbi:MAG: hypothetical protein IAG13_00385 [Deltaproteobacteria bacterium]|nr:hypothetical protein [Nannocystaceae bacterium]
MDAKQARALIARDPFVGVLQARVRQGAGVDLLRFVDRVTEGPWTSHPRGFKFTCSDRSGLFVYLMRSPRYGRDPRDRDAFREVSAGDSIHITVDAKGNGVVHLDTISIADKKGANGDVVYKDPMTVLRHIQRDLLHLDEPFAAPFDGPVREGW